MEALLSPPRPFRVSLEAIGLKSKGLFFLRARPNNVQQGLRAALALVFTLCTLTHLMLAHQPILVLLLLLRPTFFCPDMSEDAVLGPLLFQSGHFPWVSSCGFKNSCGFEHTTNPQKTHSFMILAQAISLFQT